MPPLTSSLHLLICVDLVPSRQMREWNLSCLPLGETALAITPRTSVHFFEGKGRETASAHEHHHSWGLEVPPYCPTSTPLVSATILVSVGHLLSMLAWSRRQEAWDFPYTQVSNAGLQVLDCSSQHCMLQPLTFRHISTFLGLAWWSFSQHTVRLWI